MAQSYAGFREEAGCGESDAYAGSEFNHDRKYDKLIVISRSGTTSEVVDLLKKSKIPSLVITGVEGSPVTKFATESIIMEYADEKSLIQTRWATAVLGLLRAHDGLDLMKAASDAEIALESDLGDLVNVEQITFLGRGWTIGLAQGRAVWMFGEIDSQLESDILATGALLEKSSLDPMAHLIRAQRLAIEIAKGKGLDPDNPRGLGRSVILHPAK